MSGSDDETAGSGALETLLTHGGRRPEDHFGFVNTPVFRGSTVLFKTLKDLDEQSQPYLYGRAGNPTTRGVEEIVSALEGAHDTHLVPSGLAAVTLALLSSLSSGDEVLMTDSVYEPARHVANSLLSRMGISVRYYDPCCGGSIAELIGERTRAIYVESPGSLTFEVQDLPAIAAAAKLRGVRTIVDNSWATPLYHRPLALGANIVLHAGTKMFVGHSDAFAGTVSATADAWPDVASTRRHLGLFTSGDEAFLTARGLRTLAIRMKEHETRTLEMASWLEAQEGVERVIHPGLPSHPQHALFKRDFSGSGSLFGFFLPPRSRAAVAAFVDALSVFTMGYSWGGYESLLIPTNPTKVRTAVPFGQEGNLFRLHIGFEAMDDLKGDLSAGIKRYLAAA